MVVDDFRFIVKFTGCPFFLIAYPKIFNSEKCLWHLMYMYMQSFLAVL